MNLRSGLDDYLIRTIVKVRVIVRIRKNPDGMELGLKLDVHLIRSGEGQIDPELP